MAIALTALALLLVPIAVLLVLRRGKRASVLPAAQGGEGRDAAPRSVRGSTAPPLDQVLEIAATAEPADPTTAEDELERGWNILDNYLGGDTRVLSEAARAFQRVISVRPEDPSPWLGLSEAAFFACHQGGDEYDAAGLARSKHLVDRAVALSPPGSQAEADGRALEALYLWEMGEAKEAGARMPGLPTDNWRLCFVTAKLVTATKNPIVATKAMRSACNNAPRARRSGLLDNLGCMLADYGRFDEAMATFDEAVALRPDNAWAWMNRAQLLWRLGRAADARRSCERALSVMEFPAARALLGRLEQAPAPSRPPRAQRDVTLCPACLSRLDPAAASCGRCGEPAGEELVLTEEELEAFRRKPCPQCGAELVGIATRCGSCRASA